MNIFIFLLVISTIGHLIYSTEQSPHSRQIMSLKQTTLLLVNHPSFFGLLLLNKSALEATLRLSPITPLSTLVIIFQTPKLPSRILREKLKNDNNLRFSNFGSKIAKIEARETVFNWPLPLRELPIKKIPHTGDKASLDRCG